MDRHLTDRRLRLRALLLSRPEVEHAADANLVRLEVDVGEAERAKLLRTEKVVAPKWASYALVTSRRTKVFAERSARR